MFKKELKNYLKTFENDLNRIEDLVKFADDAIHFIINKDLYPDFLLYNLKREK